MRSMIIVLSFYPVFRCFVLGDRNSPWTMMEWLIERFSDCGQTVSEEQLYWFLDNLRSISAAELHLLKSHTSGTDKLTNYFLVKGSGTFLSSWFAIWKHWNMTFSLSLFEKITFGSVRDMIINRFLRWGMHQPGKQKSIIWPNFSKRKNGA